MLRTCHEGNRYGRRAAARAKASCGRESSCCSVRSAFESAVTRCVSRTLTLPWQSLPYSAMAVDVHQEEEFVVSEAWAPAAAHSPALALWPPQPQHGPTKTRVSARTLACKPKLDGRNSRDGAARGRLQPIIVPRCAPAAWHCTLAAARARCPFDPCRAIASSKAEPISAGWRRLPMWVGYLLFHVSLFDCRLL